MDTLRGPRIMTGIFLFSMVLALWGACPAGAGEAGAASGNVRVLEGVEGFGLDYDSGGMAIHALASCLKATGAASGYYGLVGLSRSAFKFVYDSTEAYEPLRDLYPVDVLREAATVVGYPDCHWEINKSIDTVKSLIKQEIDSGRPVITPFLATDAYHGFFVITGYDYDQGLLYLQGALGVDSGYVSVPVPDYWDGPTASPEGWARNPVFVLGEARAQMERRGAAERKSVKAGIRLFKGGTLEYGTHPGEQAYMRETGPHTATYGLPAYDVLSRDVESEPVLVEGDGGEVVNFGFLWRLDSQLGQLRHDRYHGSTYMRSLSRFLRYNQRLLLGEIADNFDRTVADVEVLRRMFWDPVPDSCRTPDDVTAYIERGESIVYWMGGVGGVSRELASRGLVGHETPWGPVVVFDSPAKRLAAKMLVKSIASRERHSMLVMRDIVEHIGRLKPDALKPEQGRGRGREHVPR